MGEKDRRVDAIRYRSSEMENHLIDTYSAGKINRREFVRRGTVLGMSLSSIGFLASACGSGDSGGTTTAPAEQARSGASRAARSRSAVVTPLRRDRSRSRSPTRAASPCSARRASTSSGRTAKLNAEPRLAESWTPNEDASVWTFKIRQGVKFHDGAPMTADDVAASINRLSDPKSASAALSAFSGVLSKDSAEATDPQTVVFTLDAPNGNFPYLVSSDNYNTIILPKNYDGDYEQNQNGTGPFKLDKYTQGQSATYVKNPDYWDTERQPNPDNTELRFYAKEPAQVVAVQSGEVNALSHFSATGGRALLTDSNIDVLGVKSSVHRQMHMRTDKEPFTDKRVRQAVALLLDRQGLVDGLFQGKAALGNDSPFAPVYKYTDTSIPQRTQDVEQAKQLLAEAGMADGFSVTLDTWDGFEIPDLAQLVQDNAKQAGIDIKLNITDAGTYYGDAVFGSSPWLDSTMGITDYGHRGVVNVFLGAPLLSKGTWNAAHFKNSQYDNLVKEFTAQTDIDAQMRVAGQIQTLLLDETPIVFPYFYDFLTAVRKGYSGIETTAMGHVQLTGAGQV